MMLTVSQNKPQNNSREGKSTTIHGPSFRGFTIAANNFEQDKMGWIG
jgi:hypothetical protein